jgi:hypothetical protein
LKSYISLAVFEAADGNIKKVEFYRNRMRPIAERLGAEATTRYADAEIFALLGNQKESIGVLEELEHEEKAAYRDEAEMARIYWLIGLHSKSIKLRGSPQKDTKARKGSAGEVSVKGKPTGQQTTPIVDKSETSQPEFASTPDEPQIKQESPNKGI